jgi:hypothetical protein
MQGLGDGFLFRLPILKLCLPTAGSLHTDWDDQSAPNHSPTPDVEIVDIYWLGAEFTGVYLTVGNRGYSFLRNRQIWLASMPRHNPQG